MSVKLIKVGEPFHFSSFNPQSLEVATQAAAAAAATAAAFAPRPQAAPVSNPVAPDHSLTAAAAGAEPAMTEHETIEVIPNGELILQQAREEAELLIAKARAQAAEIEKAARERGLAEAQARAQAELGRAVEALRAQLAASIDEVAGLQSGLAARAEQDLVRLALEIAKKIVHREVKVDHEVALTLARVALGRLHSRTGATVRLHPDDYAYVCAHRERLDVDSAVEIVEDRSVGVGGCIVQGEMGEIDARIEQQFAEIESDFLST